MQWEALNLRRCLQDDPHHRKTIEQNTELLLKLETLSKSIHKLGKQAIEAGRDYQKKNMMLIQELLRSRTEIQNSFIEPIWTSCCSVLHEIEEKREMMFEHTVESFLKPLDSFICDNLHSIKELKKKFDQSTDALDHALDKYLSKKTSDPSIPESAKEVETVRHQFHASSLTVCTRFNALMYMKDIHTLESFLTYLQMQLSFYHQTYEQFKTLQPYMHQLNQCVSQIKAQWKKELNDMDHLQQAILASKSHMYNPMHQGLIEQVKWGGPTMKGGYLFKKNQAQRVRVTWSRRYFMIRDELLVYTARGKETQDHVVAMNLKVSTVKPADPSCERRFCFQVISSQKNYTLQAENQEDMQSWIDALQRAISAALNSNAPVSHQGLNGNKKELISLSPTHLPNSSITSTSTSSTPTHATSHTNTTNITSTTTTTVSMMDDPKHTLLHLRSIHGNHVCADCGNEDPEWASLNLGILLCIECSGIHRSLGVHVSKVRSLILDKWDPETVLALSLLGNIKVNQIFLAQFTDTSSSSSSSSTTAAQDLTTTTMFNPMDSSSSGHVGSTLSTSESVEHDTESPKVFPPFPRDQWIVKKYVHKAYLDTSSNYTSTQWDTLFLKAMMQHDLSAGLNYLVHGANVDSYSSSSGRTALHQALINQNEIVAEMLLIWQCQVDLQDSQGRTALHYCADLDLPRMAVKLLKRNATCNVKDQNNETPLDIALRKTHVQMVTVLRLYTVNQANPQVASKFGIQQAIQDLQLKSINVTLPPLAPPPLNTSSSSSSSSMPSSPMTSSLPFPSPSTSYVPSFPTTSPSSNPSFQVPSSFYPTSTSSPHSPSPLPSSSSPSSSSIGGQKELITDTQEAEEAFASVSPVKSTPKSMVMVPSVLGDEANPWG